MAVTYVDYPAELVAAAKSVLLELTRILNEYRDDIVIIGGWVPELLFGGHIGSLDIDLALDHIKLQEAGYKSIERILLSHGYRRDEKQPYIYHRTVKLTREDANVESNTKVKDEIDVEVDLLSGEYAGTTRGHRHQRIQDINARKVRGCDLAFGMYTEVQIEGTLPEGEKAAVAIRVASVVPFLVMKGMALPRAKAKDSWDIYFCLTRYPGGLDALAQEFMPHVEHGLVQEGLLQIAAEFASPDHMGPKHVADFEDLRDAETREIRKRDAYERVDYLLKKLGFR